MGRMSTSSKYRFTATLLHEPGVFLEIIETQGMQIPPDVVLSVSDSPGPAQVLPLTV